MRWAEDVLARREVWGRAPSAHNTQPWLLAVGSVRPAGGSGEDVLVLGWDESRHLSDGDPSRRDLLLGLGAVAQSLVVVAADLRHAVAVDWDVHVDRRRAAVLRRTGALDPDTAPPWTGSDLLARRTARGPYRPPWVGAEGVAGLASEAALPAGAALEVVDAEWLRRWLPVADRWVLEGPAAPELARWLRLSRGHPRYQHDGLTAEALGLSSAEALGLRVATSSPGRRILSRTGAMRLLAASATARPLGTVVALTARPAHDLAQVGELGMALMRVWLAAADHGWTVHPLSALLDCPASRAAWSDAAAPVTASAPQWSAAPYAVFRLGVPRTPAPASGRLPG